MMGSLSRVRKERTTRRSLLAVVSLFSGVCCIHAAGCLPFCDVSGILLVRGYVVDADTAEPLPDVAVGGRTFTGDVETDFSPALTVFGDANNRAPDADGMFEVFFATSLMPCQEPPPEFPRPDQVEIIVVRDGCEQTFPIEINEETARDVVDPEFPYADVIELTEPILVPACQE